MLNDYYEDLKIVLKSKKRNNCELKECKKKIKTKKLAINNRIIAT